MITKAELMRRFTYHPPKDDQPVRYQEIRDMAHVFADMIIDMCPESREQSIAITKLEECVMWANAGIARRE